MDAPAGTDDEAVVAAYVRTRNPDLFRLRVERHQERVFRLVASILGPFADLDAEEVTREVFVRVHARLDSFRGEACFSTWLHRLAYNRTIERRRRARLRVEHVSAGGRGGRSTLAAAGYRVTVGGADDLPLPTTGYELILVDDILANRASSSLLRMLRNGGVLAKTVAVSSNPRVERTKEGKFLGLHDLIAKPYTPASLLAEVRRAVSAIRHGH